MNRCGMQKRAGIGCRSALGAVLLTLGSLAAAHPQAAIPGATGAGPGARILVASSGLVPAESGFQGKIVREIFDPHTGKHWLLLRDGEHPGGPGRLVVAANSGDPDSPNKSRQDQSGAVPVMLTTLSGQVSFRPVIRAGDRLIVEEHTAVVEAYLEAVALSPAASGAAFNVRLKMGGRTLRAVALGPGRAVFQAETGVQP